MATVYDLRVSPFLQPSNFANLTAIEKAIVLDIVQIQAAAGLFPSMTTVERVALSPTTAMIVQDTTLEAIFIYNTTTGWSPLQ